MKDNRIDPITGVQAPDPNIAPTTNCSPGMALRRPSGSQAVVGAVVEGGRAVGEEGRSWVARNKLLVAGGIIFTYVMLARLLGGTALGL